MAIQPETPFTNHSAESDRGVRSGAPSPEPQPKPSKMRLEEGDFESGEFGGVGGENGKGKGEGDV